MKRIGLVVFLIGITVSIAVSEIFSYEKYIKKVKPRDFKLRKIASKAVKPCRNIGIFAECDIVKIYNFVTRNFDYYGDPSGGYIQDPFKTIKLRGGDCEDLAILTSSLLENIGIHTYLVFTYRHAYTLACGYRWRKNQSIDVDLLKRFIKLDFVDNFIKKNFGYKTSYLGRDINHLKFSFEKLRELKIPRKSKKSIEIYVPDNEYFIRYLFNNSDYTIKYALVSSIPVNIYIKSSNKWCEKEGLKKFAGRCKNMKEPFRIIIQNTSNFKSAKIKLRIKLEGKVDVPRLFKKIYRGYLNIRSYYIEGNRCIVLDPVFGEDGYPGLEMEKYVNSPKDFVDPLNRRIYHFEP